MYFYVLDNINGKRRLSMVGFFVYVLLERSLLLFGWTFFDSFFDCV
jgi:hypothetical protein